MKSIRKVWSSVAIAAIPAALALTATPAAATAPPPSGTLIGGCSTSLTLPTPDAINCAGYYSGNVLNGSSTDVANQTAALASLGFTWDGNWAAMDASTNPDLVITSLTNGNQLNFGTTLFGTVIIGAHFGNIPVGTPGNLGNVSVFWLFNLATPTNYIILDNTQGWSNAALYTTGTPPSLPEPGTWAMMIAGFGAAGIAIRRSRRRKVLAQIA
jgi:hypothetical protein